MNLNNYHKLLTKVNINPLLNSLYKRNCHKFYTLSKQNPYSKIILNNSHNFPNQYQFYHLENKHKSTKVETTLNNKIKSNSNTNNINNTNTISYSNLTNNTKVTPAPNKVMHINKSTNVSNNTISNVSNNNNNSINNNSISKDLLVTTFLFNGYFYTTSIYFGLMAFGIITNPNSILITDLARMTFKNIFILNSIWGGVNLGYIMSKQDEDIDDHDQLKFFSRITCLTFIPGIASFFISQNLINSTALSLSIINYSFTAFGLLQLIHIGITFILANKRIAPNQYFKHQVLLGLLNLVCLAMLYFFLNNNKDIIIKKGDMYRIDNLKYMDELIEEDDKLLGEENEEYFMEGILEVTLEELGKNNF